MKKIITLLTLIFAFGQISFGAQIPYPSNSKLMAKFKSEFRFENFKKENRFKSDMKLSSCKISFTKFNGKNWEETRSSIVKSNRKTFETWPNDVLYGYVQIITPKNLYGETVRAKYAVVYQRSEKDVYGFLRLKNNWTFKEVLKREMNVSNSTLTNELSTSLTKEFFLNEYNFNDKLKEKLVKIDNINIKYEKANYISTTYVIIPTVIETNLQYEKKGKLINEKYTIYGEITIYREKEKEDKWTCYSPFIIKKKSEIIENSGNKKHGTLEFYTAKDIYQKYMPYKVKPNSEEAKLEFGKMVHAKLMSFNYDLETKDKVVTEIQKLVLNNDIENAKKVWESFYRLKILQITLSDMKVGHIRYPVTKGKANKKSFSSDYNVEYTTNRNLSKSDIKILKKKYDKAKYYKYWIKVLSEKKLIIQYSFYYENKKWSIKSIFIPTL